MVDGSLESPYNFLFTIVELLSLALTAEALQGKTWQDSLLPEEGRSLGAQISGGRGRPWRIYVLVSTKLDTFCYLTVQTASCYVPSF